MDPSPVGPVVASSLGRPESSPGTYVPESSPGGVELDEMHATGAVARPTTPASPTDEPTNQVIRFKRFMMGRSIAPRLLRAPRRVSC